MSRRKEIEEVVEGLACACLTKLIEIGRVTREQVAGKWYVEISDERLLPRRLFAATTIDNNGQTVMYVRSALLPEELVSAIPHEAVHLMQICKGDLIPGYGYQVWKGKRYPSLAADDPNYFEAQPWEAEARELSLILSEELERRYLACRA